jgi:hypothetical protein
MIALIICLVLLVNSLIIMAVNINANNKQKKAAYIKILEDLEANPNVEELKAKYLKKILDMDK